MYLALKWLIFLGIAMWALLCCIDYHVNKNSSQGLTVRLPVWKNKLPKENMRIRNHQRQSLAFINYLTFIAGALAVSLYNKKSEIIYYASRQVKSLDFRANSVKVVLYLKKTAGLSRVTLLKKTMLLWEKIKDKVSLIKISFSVQNEESRSQRNLLLLKRLREVGIERNKLAQLLVVAVEQNKNIKLQCYLENLAKNRLIQQIQDTQDQIKENRSKYIKFYQQHLVTNQENVYLKNRLKKLTNEKQEAEASLMKLVNRIYQSLDNNLKAYCTCFMVQTKEKLLSNNERAADASKQQYHSAESFNTKKSCNREENANVYNTNSLPSTSMSRMPQEAEYVVPFSSEDSKPRLRGLPGEYVWTIKDKDGIIEKLYEYDFGYNYDNGDTVRRIREYSVYHDSDCLLDIGGSRASTTIIRNSNPSGTVTHNRNGPNVSTSESPRSSTFTMPHRKFLTGSPVFQQFLKTNNNFPALFPVARAPSPPMLCG